VQSLFPFRRGLTPPQCPVPYFPHPDGRSGYSLQELQYECLPDKLVECPLIS
jgi:hypothetical protein